MNALAENIVIAAVKNKCKTAFELNAVKRHFSHLAKSATTPSSSSLLTAYHKLVAKNKIQSNKDIEKLFIKRAIRTLSGVTIITVLTEPFKCPGECIYCPSEKNMPKSYISDEPAAARALALCFDPYEQVKKRIEALKNNGHPTDKIELIVKGGTWNAYPLNYQYWFILRCFEACNNSRIATSRNTGAIELKNKIKKAQNKNEKAAHRIIGLTLETRPDQINERNILIMRELGCTRVEIGAQTIDEKILLTIKRGHGTKEIVEATKLLKQHGFKVDFHLMPQLPGSTPKKDLWMLNEIFANSDYRPDMIKIYPCTVVDNSELYEWLKNKKYRPYSDRDLIEVLKKFKSSIPYYARISRLIRDIPAHHIKAGNTMTNLRQAIAKEMADDGIRCRCLRCREIGHQKIQKKYKTKLFIEKYQANGGAEYFLSFEDAKRMCVFAFCRLRIDPHGIFPAFIRELHTYGQSLAIDAKEQKAIQHKGLGKKLISEAEKICKKNRIKKLAVISGVGVRNYYHKLGFNLEKTYMVKNLNMI